jgi:polyferredoxin
MEEKSFSEKMEEFVETLKLYVVQNVYEAMDAALLQPLERMRRRMVVTAASVFLFLIAFVFFALALSFLSASLFMYFFVSATREVIWGLSFLFVFLVFSISGFILLRRVTLGTESHKQ